MKKIEVEICDNERDDFEEFIRKAGTIVRLVGIYREADMNNHFEIAKLRTQLAKAQAPRVDPEALFRENAELQARVERTEKSARIEQGNTFAEAIQYSVAMHKLEAAEAKIKALVAAGNALASFGAVIPTTEYSSNRLWNALVKDWYDVK